MQFATDYQSILNKIEDIDPILYGKTRNYINGSVSYLSPYISRGVISTKLVLERLLKKGYKISSIESFVKELCWRDYFQRVGQIKNLTKNIKQAQTDIVNNEIPSAIIEAKTGITGIDQAINELYTTGYMHNHCRMYTSSVVCNISKSHWLLPSQWMYFHLLDGDWASNICSWQWVCAANSHKKYFANQENINKFTFTKQRNTFLDKKYEELEQMAIPSQLISTQMLELETILPTKNILNIDTSIPTFIYNYYNLDPCWHDSEPGNRILLLEPEFFKMYPVSKKCIEFVISLSKNIPNSQVYVGSFDELREDYLIKSLYYKEHPLNVGYYGIEEPRDWITDAVTGYYPSFFSYWKRVERELKK